MRTKVWIFGSPDWWVQDDKFRYNWVVIESKTQKHNFGDLGNLGIIDVETWKDSSKAYQRVTFFYQQILYFVIIFLLLFSSFIRQIHLFLFFPFPIYLFPLHLFYFITAGSPIHFFKKSGPTLGHPWTIHCFTLWVTRVDILCGACFSAHCVVASNNKCIWSPWYDQ